MRSTQIFAAAAALAPAVSAGVIPRADVDCNFATGWGCWSVTNLTEQIPPSANFHTFSFIFGHESQTATTTCTGTSEQGITCDDPAYQASIDLGVTTLTLHQKLYQTGAIAVLGGNASLAPTCTPSSTGSNTCTQPAFKVKSELVGSIFPNGTTEGYTF